VRFIGGESIKPVQVWGNSFRATAAHAQHARGAALFVRLAIAASALLAAGCTAALADGSRPWQWLLIIGVPGVACAVLPDSHFGLVVIVAVVVPWLASVDDRTSPWSAVLGVLLAVFHVSMAAAASAPGAARWTPTMSRRYLQRVLAASAAAVFAWLVIVGLDEYAPSSPAVAVGALFVLAIGAVWARSGAVRGRL
jgi:hypothetical protein